MNLEFVRWTDWRDTPEERDFSQLSADLKAQREFFRTHPPIWTTNPEACKSYAAIYGAASLQKAVSFLKLAENFDPSWVVPAPKLIFDENTQSFAAQFRTPEEAKSLGLVWGHDPVFREVDHSNSTLYHTPFGDIWVKNS
jgi:hypothetical protein